MFNVKMILIVVMILWIGGCSITIEDIELIRIHSVPSGATVVEKDTGKKLGVTPLAFYYRPSVQERSEGYLNTRVNVYWPDGRKKENEPFSLKMLENHPLFQHPDTRMENSPLYTFTAPPLLRVTYKSYPSGAMLIENETGKNWGTTPLVVIYIPEEKHLNAGRLVTRKMTAYWPDGRKIKGERLFISLSGNPSGGDIVSEQTLIAPPFENEEQRRNAVIHMQQGSSPSYQNNSNGDHTNLYAEAKRQYESALAGYNLALANLDKARNMKGVVEWSRPAVPKKGWGALAGLFNEATSSGGVQDAERELRIALERLQRAKAKLRAAEY